jgi:superfamily II DNA/RNA helicase
VKVLTRELKKMDLQAGEIHSDLEQKDREKILLQFKSRSLHLLVATDIISRGIDIEDIDLIINYNVPSDGEDYIHRIGRTARAESDGMAITLVNQEDQDKFGRIEELMEAEVDKGVVPEFLGETPEYNPRKANKNKRYGGNKKGKRPSNSKKPSNKGKKNESQNKKHD